MSTKITVKHHDENMETGIGGFCVYRECFDEETLFAYLEVSGVPFTATNVACLDLGTGLSSVSVRMPEEWARRLGVIES